MHDKILERQNNVFELIRTMHMFCILLMMTVLAIEKQLFSGDIYPLYKARVLFFVCLIGLEGVFLYNNNSKIRKYSSWIDFLYVFFPVVLSVLIVLLTTGNTWSVRAVFLLPIIISASILGKRYGLFVAGGMTAIVLLIDFWKGLPILGFSNYLVFIGVMFIVGYFIGGWADMEVDFRTELISIANTDALTRLYNHRYFYDQIEKQLEKCEANVQPLSLVMLDIDYFKHYNDSFGHPAGDQVLQKVGEILSKLEVGEGFAARYGGEEFVVVLPDCPEDKAIQIAHQIRNNIKENSFIGEEHQPEGKITVSCGVATYPNHARSMKNLIKCADEALYKAKSFEKDKVELYFSVFDNLEIAEDEKDFINSTRTLVSVINAKDRYTYGHSERVSENAGKIAVKMGMTEEEIRLLSYASFLHDIGKIEIDRVLLNKSGKLTPDEWNIFMQHPRWGSEIVKGNTQLEPIAPIILHHHENYDGTGYPNRLSGEDIPLLSRMIRVADSYDAMITYRPYKKQMSPKEAIQELERCSGKMFDPEIVRYFTGILKEELFET